MAAVTIDGSTNKRATLAANTETIVTFYNQAIKKIHLAVEGGTVYFKVNDSVSSASDLNANQLDSVFPSVSFWRDGYISEIHFFCTTGTPMIQWIY